MWCCRCFKKIAFNLTLATAGAADILLCLSSYISHCWHWLLTLVTADIGHWWNWTRDDSLPTLITADTADIDHCGHWSLLTWLTADIDHCWHCTLLTLISADTGFCWDWSLLTFVSSDIVFSADIWFRDSYEWGGYFIELVLISPSHLLWLFYLGSMLLRLVPRISTSANVLNHGAPKKFSDLAVPSKLYICWTPSYLSSYR